MKKICLNLLLVWFLFQGEAQAQLEFNFGLSSGMYIKNSFGNLKIHAFKQNEYHNYSDPIKITNGFIGYNFEFRAHINNVWFKRFTFVSSYNANRSVFSGGGVNDSTGYDEKFNYKFKYAYIQLMGTEFKILDDGPHLAVGISCDLGTWKLYSKWEREEDQHPEYKKFYKAFQLSYSAWLRFSPFENQRVQFVLATHNDILPSDVNLIEYRYRIKNVSLSMKLKLNK